jgi:hypothetical protein
MTVPSQPQGAIDDVRTPPSCQYRNHAHARICHHSLTFGIELPSAFAAKARVLDQLPSSDEIAEWTWPQTSQARELLTVQPLPNTTPASLFSSAWTSGPS